MLEFEVLPFDVNDLAIICAALEHMQEAHHDMQATKTLNKICESLHIERP
jgi:hypothetical protein